MYNRVCLKHYIFKHAYVLRVKFSAIILRTEALVPAIAARFTAKRMRFAS
jgi:hypothetical protein